MTLMHGYSCIHTAMINMEQLTLSCCSRWVLNTQMSPNNMPPTLFFSLYRRFHTVLFLPFFFVLQEQKFIIPLIKLCIDHTFWFLGNGFWIYFHRLKLESSTLIIQLKECRFLIKKHFYLILIVPWWHERKIQVCKGSFNQWEWTNIYFT